MSVIKLVNLIIYFLRSFVQKVSYPHLDFKLQLLATPVHLSHRCLSDYLLYCSYYYFIFVLHLIMNNKLLYVIFILYVIIII